jgi:hypothetical protein
MARPAAARRGAARGLLPPLLLLAAAATSAAAASAVVPLQAHPGVLRRERGGSSNGSGPRRRSLLRSERSDISGSIHLGYFTARLKVGLAWAPLEGGWCMGGRMAGGVPRSMAPAPRAHAPLHALPHARRTHAC